MTTAPQLNEAAKQALTIARTQLLLNNGFFGMLALRLRLIEDKSQKTLAVDGKNMYYNPDFVLALSPELRKSAVAHEVMHCVFDHIGRRGDRTPKRWNWAGDYAINQILADSGMEIAPTWLMSPLYKGKSADEIYTALPEDEGDNGSNDGAFDDVMDAPHGQSQAQAVEWKVAAVQAATAQAARGKLPGSLQRFMDEVTKTPVDWRAQLRAFMTSTGKNDYSWARPNRRYLNAGFFMPTLYSENMGPIVIGVDTSGSITQPILDSFAAEIRAIVDNVRPSEIHVIYCDAEVNHVDKYTPDDEITLTGYGGGGTAFKPVFDYVEENDIKPECLVYLTDLYGDHNFESPQYPTLWACTSPVVGSFGETIAIEV